MVWFEIERKDGEVDCVEGADTYALEGPLTTFFRTDPDRQVIDAWSVRLSSIRTVDIVRIRRREDALPLAS
jgi:hypothetical protein